MVLKMILKERIWGFRNINYQVGIAELPVLAHCLLTYDIGQIITLKTSISLKFQNYKPK